MIMKDHPTFELINQYWQTLHRYRGAILFWIYLMAIMAYAQATLTLPGIAGIILTVGMSVDANVLINERIREELRRNKTARAAVDSGYSNATRTIVDANVTTLIAAIVLFSFGTGPIKGFAVTLSLGIITSMFTAIMGTRAVIRWLSFNLDDVIIPTEKETFVTDGYSQVDDVIASYNMGVITNNERYNQIIDKWTYADNRITDTLMTELAEHKQGFNSVYMMLDSGARGSKEQIRQLTGMRGLMAKPSGEIIETPIQANFREGLSVLQYFISTHGARKGLADTALKTANSGYLTRRLADVAQDHGRFRRQVVLQLDMVLLVQEGHQVQRLQDGGIQVDRGGGGVLDPHVGLDARNQLDDGFAGGIELLVDAAKFFGRHLAAFDHPVDHVQVARDNEQGIVDLVRDTGRQQSDRGHLVAEQQALVAVFQFLVLFAELQELLDHLVVVPPQARVEGAQQVAHGKRRALDDHVESRRRNFQQHGRLQRRHGGVAGVAGDQRHLAEIIAGVQPRQRDPLLGDRDRAGLDEEHRFRGAALLADHFIRFEMPHDRFLRDQR